MKIVFILILMLTPVFAFSKTEPYPIIINQIMIGQENGAKNEFVELYNPNDYPISLDGFSLKKKTASGNESNLISSNNFSGKINPRSYFLISSREFGDQISSDLQYSTSNSLAKNNTVLLYGKSGDLHDKLGYGEVLDFYGEPAPNPLNNQALKRFNISTGNDNNKNDFKIVDELIEIYNFKNQKIKIINKKNTSGATLNKEVAGVYHLKDLDKTKSGDKITIKGIVSVLPGILGSQFFYIHDEGLNGKNHGLQVYSYYKRFPSLSLGDEVMLSGEMVVSEIEYKNSKIKNYRIKTNDTSNISIISSNNKLPKPISTKIKGIDYSNIKSIIELEGEITQNRAGKIYLDDGSEILVEIKKETGINSKDLKEGGFLKISGILSQRNNELILMPTTKEDIKSDKKVILETGEKMLEDKFLELDPQESNKILIKYIFFTIISILFFVIFNKKII
jgi:predicted extracellular nuclease